MQIVPYFVRTDGPDVKAKLDSGPVLTLSPESARLLASDIRMVESRIYEGNWQERIPELLDSCADEAEKYLVH